MCTVPRIRTRRSKEANAHRKMMNNSCCSAAQATWTTLRASDPFGDHCTALKFSSKQSTRNYAGRTSLQKIILAIIFLCTIMETSLTLAAVLSRGITGFDISNYQRTVDFTSAYDAGAQFVIIKVSLPLTSLKLSCLPPVKFSCKNLS